MGVHDRLGLNIVATCKEILERRDRLLLFVSVE